MNKESFRDRSRREYEERRAEARLGPAQRTCATLDERAGKEVMLNGIIIYTHTPFPLPSPTTVHTSSHLSNEKKRWLSANVLVPQFNVLWLDPINPDTFPAGLFDAVANLTAAATTATTPARSGKDDKHPIEERLREQMRADALQPLDDDDDDPVSSPKNAGLNSESHLPPKWVEDAAQFLRLNVSNHDLRPVRGYLPHAPLFFRFPLTLADKFCVTSPRNAWTVFCNICARNITTVSGVEHSIKVPTKWRKSVRVLRKICTTR